MFSFSSAKTVTVSLNKYCTRGAVSKKMLRKKLNPMPRHAECKELKEDAFVTV
jgi:hypothetical protein